jgi:putative ATP-binding cassette transporter
MALSAVAGICAGAATVALLATINQVLNRPDGLLLTFVALCATALVGRATSDISTNLVGQRLVTRVA